MVRRRTMAEVPRCHVLPQTKQVKALHTIIRDQNTPRDDFVFYSDRLIRMLIEEGLGMLPFEEKEVTTPTGANYKGTLLSHTLSTSNISSSVLLPLFDNVMVLVPVSDSN